MRTLQEIFRLKYETALSHRQIARRCGIGHPTVGAYVRRLEEAGLDWAQASSMDEATLEAKLFSPPPPPSAGSRAEPDWAEVHRELKRKGVTLMLLWQEYKATHPDGFQYTWLCDHYRAWAGKLDVVMRQHHPAAESGVLLAQRWILARLRNRQFFSLAELNAAIAELRERLNDHPFQKLPGSRRSVFETLERAALKPLPAQPFEYAAWKPVRAGIDYHVAVEGHYYSVPYQLIKR